MNWTCEKIPLYIDHYLEGSLSRRDRLAYKAHVEKCPRCCGYFGREAPGPDGTTRWSCRTVALFLDDYLKEELSVRDKFTYEAHLQACPKCREGFDLTSALIKASHQLGGALTARDLERSCEIPQKVWDHMVQLPTEAQLRLAEIVSQDMVGHQERLERREKAQKKSRPTKTN